MCHFCFNCDDPRDPLQKLPQKVGNLDWKLGEAEGSTRVLSCPPFPYSRWLLWSPLSISFNRSEDPVEVSRIYWVPFLILTPRLSICNIFSLSNEIGQVPVSIRSQRINKWIASGECPTFNVFIILSGTFSTCKYIILIYCDNLNRK